MNDAIQFFWKLSVLAEVALVMHLLLQGLGGKYPALLAGSCVFALRSMLLMASMGHRLAFTRSIWKVTEPLEWMIWAWIVFELFTHWTYNYRGIGRFGRLLLAVFLLASFGISAVLSPLEWQLLVSKGDLRIFYAGARAIIAALALFMMATSWFFSKYPAPVPPNVRHHTRVLVFYLAATSLAGLAANLFGARMGSLAYQWVNLTLVLSTACSFSLWSVLLTREREVRVGGPPPSTPSQKADIDRINEELLDWMKDFKLSEGSPR